jgi:hypothetical protein
MIFCPSAPTESAIMYTIAFDVSSHLRSRISRRVLVESATVAVRHDPEMKRMY